MLGIVVYVCLRPLLHKGLDEGMTREEHSLQTLRGVEGYNLIVIAITDNNDGRARFAGGESRVVEGSQIISVANRYEDVNAQQIGYVLVNLVANVARGVEESLHSSE